MLHKSTVSDRNLSPEKRNHYVGEKNGQLLFVSLRKLTHHRNLTEDGVQSFLKFVYSTSSTLTIFDLLFRFVSQLTVHTKFFDSIHVRKSLRTNFYVILLFLLRTTVVPVFHSRFSCHRFLLTDPTVVIYCSRYCYRRVTPHQGSGPLPIEYRGPVPDSQFRSLRSFLDLGVRSLLKSLTSLLSP